ncbi:MAG: TonB family protein [Oxalobacteraceae bacterium]|nr:TonB family protein [Oxalobacteraceae bacterium]
MMSGTNPQRSTIVALLAAIALHLALITSASVWLAPPVRPEQRAPILIVTLHRAVPVTAAAANMPTAPPQARSSDRTPRSAPLPKKKTQSRRPAAAHKPAPHASNTPPATPPSQPTTPIAPSATPGHPSESAPAAAAATAETSPAAAATGVTIPAAYAARNRKPDYPLMSRRYNEQGTVVLRVLVNADGTAGEVFIRKSSTYPLLDRSALAAVRNWRFVAATRDGKPVSEWYEISIPYTLQD